MSRLLTVFVLTLLLGACRTVGTAEVASEALEVVSFNLRLNVASDGENAWPHRRAAAAAMIENADLVGVQEALSDMLVDLDAALPQFDRIGTGRSAEGGDEYSAILYRADRFEVLDSGTFWLSETPDVPGSVGWDAALPRIATWGRFRDRRSGVVFSHVNTHFDHRGETARQQSARLLVDWIGARGGEPVLLTGDFNQTPDSEVYRLLTEGMGLHDARLVSATPARGSAATWNDFGRTTPTGPIDFVFVNELVTVQRFATWDQTLGAVLGTDDAHLPSDHFPVAATVILKAP